MPLTIACRHEYPEISQPHELEVLGPCRLCGKAYVPRSLTLSQWWLEISRVSSEYHGAELARSFR